MEKKNRYFIKKIKNCFKFFSYKIIHIVVEDIPHKYLNIDIDTEKLVRKRNKISILNKKYLFLISDVDEIINSLVI